MPYLMACLLNWRSAKCLPFSRARARVGCLAEISMKRTKRLDYFALQWWRQNFEHPNEQVLNQQVQWHLVDTILHYAFLGMMLTNGSDHQREWLTVTPPILNPTLFFFFSLLSLSPTSPIYIIFKACHWSYEFQLIRFIFRFPWRPCQRAGTVCRS